MSPGSFPRVATCWYEIFYRSDALPVTQLTVSKQQRKFWKSQQHDANGPDAVMTKRGTIWTESPRFMLLNYRIAHHHLTGAAISCPATGCCGARGMAGLILYRWAASWRGCGTPADMLCAGNPIADGSMNRQYNIINLSKTKEIVSRRPWAQSFHLPPVTDNIEQLNCISCSEFCFSLTSKWTPMSSTWTWTFIPLAWLWYCLV